MLASLNWIKEFVDVAASPQEIADRLSMAGLEIEANRTLGEGLDKVYTATVLKVDKHPHADRLSLCEVSCGLDQVSVVCGAKNMKAGDRVVLARPGVTLPNGVTLKEAVIRKVPSHGMLCSESELGLAEESAGILILPQEVPEGLPLSEVLPIYDSIFEVNVTPNRGDCLSMVGLAREVAANFGAESKTVPLKLPKPRSKDVEVKVLNEAGDLCPRYTCRVIKGIKIKPSPLAMRRRLESCGIRAISNVVDATNYVMLETGQPLHAFDLSQVREKKIVIRRAAQGEIMKTLDGEARELNDSDLVIADGQRILALAGVMGGEDSGVGENTVDLLLESAFFSPLSVRKTAKRFSLQTESSYRFERGVDPNGCVQALDRLAQLIMELAGGELYGPVIDEYANPVPAGEVRLRNSQIKKVLGIELKASEVLEPLKGLGLVGKQGKNGVYHIKIPTFRTDLTREIDLIEEVARLYGYNRIPVTFPKIPMAQMPSPGKNQLDYLDRIRQLFVGWGFSETLHYSFTSPELLKKFHVDYAPEQGLLNPLSEDLSVMRPTLFPQLVQTLRHNIFKGRRDLKFFEIRPVYRYAPGDGAPFTESWHLCLGMSGARRPSHFLEKDEKARDPELQGPTLLDLKGYLSALVREWQPGRAHLVEKHLGRPYLHPKRQAALELRLLGPEQESLALGWMGRLHPHLLQKLDLAVPILVAEIKLDLFLTEWKNSIQFQEISPFPTVWRDLNLIVDEATPHGAVQEIIRSEGGPYLRGVELFDLYRGAPLQEGQKALTYRIEYGAFDRTLTDEEVNEAREILLDKLNEEIGATLR